MSIKSFITMCVCAFYTIGSAYAYTMEARFETQHYGVYQVILGKGEVYGVSLKQIIAKDLSQRKKFQSTAVVYPNGSAAMNGTIKEPTVGIITTENYDGSSSVTVNLNDNAKTSSYVGIYLNFKQLSKLADNRTVNSLASELAQMPLVLEGVPVDVVSKDFRGNLFYTAATGAVILDFNVIDSLYYDRKKLESVKPKCKVNILSLPDRSTNEFPLYIAGHGAVNDIICDED
ncbi:hypothetical protein [Succinivibrio dextrinosolvens]|uniref:Uncharacterized protein n=1 Tax=Succinivibrio dextrinosolvens DSM 3072 TaxID=1123324 RepID=A0A1T4VGL2_9GAMM|nr:hypothetical protein [Succinivibrio dextrinosolvens]SKA64104.1 hypothetical protein SAMN02745213_01491 [Succinivibrio dextrinosolvens DSM 3072]